jgi:hypothetical protein
MAVVKCGARMHSTQDNERRNERTRAAERWCSKGQLRSGPTFYGSDRQGRHSMARERGVTMDAISAGGTKPTLFLREVRRQT